MPLFGILMGYIFIIGGAQDKPPIIFRAFFVFILIWIVVLPLLVRIYSYYKYEKPLINN